MFKAIKLKTFSANIRQFLEEHASDQEHLIILSHTQAFRDSADRLYDFLKVAESHDLIKAALTGRLRFAFCSILVMQDLYVSYAPKVQEYYKNANTPAALPFEVLETSLQLNNFISQAITGCANSILYENGFDLARAVTIAMNVIGEEFTGQPIIPEEQKEFFMSHLYARAQTYNA